MSKTLQKLEREYGKAWCALIKARDKEWPAGTPVKCKITGFTGIITTGSLYADQVFIDGCRHSSWRNIERTEDD